MSYYTVGGILRDSIPVLTLLVATGIAAGQLLVTAENALLAIPILLVIVPPITAASGLVGSVFGSRVSTGLHMGSLLADGARQFRRDMLATVFLGVAVFAVLAVLTLLASQIFDADPGALFLQLLLIVGGTGFLVVAGMIVTVIVVGALSFRLGWDPDNIIVPVVTTAGDLLGILSFILMVKWVGL